MKKHSRLLLTLLMSTLLLCACKKRSNYTPDTPPDIKPEDKVSVKGYKKVTPTDTIVMLPNVIYTKKDINDNLLELNVDDNTITYKETPETTQAKVGDVLYSTGSPENPDGYALKIKSVKKEGGKVVYETEQAEIGDIFTKLDQKNDFEVDFDNIKVYDIEKLNDKNKKDENGVNTRGSFDFDLTELIGDDDKRLKIEAGESGLVITYILWDRDNDYETKGDQLTVKATAKPKFKDFETKYENGVFSSIGITSQKVSCELSFGAFNNDPTKSDIKERLKKRNEKLAKEAQIKLKKFLGIKDNEEVEFKIPLAKIPLKPLGPTDLLVRPMLKYYIVMGFDIDGEFYIKSEWESAQIAHTAIYSLDYHEFNLNRIGKPKTTIEASANADIEGKYGMGIAVDFEFPAFGGEEDGHYKSSKVGISLEGFGKLNLHVEHNSNTDVNEQDFNNINDWARIDTSIGMYVEPALNVYFKFFSKGKFEKKFTPKGSPYPLAEMTYTYGYYSMLKNTTESFDIKNNSGNFDNTSLVPSVARAEIKEDKVTIRALKKGSTIINLTDKDRLYKKAKLVVEVKEKAADIQPPAPKHPRMAIEYVSEYNLAQDGTFAKTHKNNESGYFTWEEAWRLAMPKGCRLPTIDEWRGIIPDTGNIRFLETKSTENVSERITIDGVTKTYTADYHSTPMRICYGLRFKGEGNTMLAAYRYQIVGNIAENNLDSHLKVTARYLGPKFSGSIDDIANETFWRSNKTNDVVRIFPAGGYESTGKNRGTRGYYWSATGSNYYNQCYNIIFNLENAQDNDHCDIPNHFNVRPFIQIAKTESTPTPKPNPNRPKLAIEYVTEYNIGKTPGVFATSYKNDASGYFTWEEAWRMAMPEGCRLPTIDEWRGIIPDSDNIKFRGTMNKENVSEKIAMNGITQTYTADYRATLNRITYALRFKGNGNTMLAAYRYELIGNIVEKDLDSHLKVTVRYLGPNFTGSIDDIANESYWVGNNKVHDIVRIFPAGGYKSNEKTRGITGYYWSATESNYYNQSYNIFFDHGSSKDNDHCDMPNHFNVRPFIQVAKAKDIVTPKPDPNRPKLAIEYVSKYNLAPDGTFATNHNNDASGYFTWNEAIGMAIPEGYHIPTLEEWRGIIPDSDNIKFRYANSKSEIKEKITVNGVTKTYTADYRTTINRVCYALRFKDDDNSMLAAYRYELVGNISENDLGSHLKVTVRYLGPNFKGSIDDIATEIYWIGNKANDVVRIFPAGGHELNGQHRGTQGYYWSSSRSNYYNQSYNIFFDHGGAKDNDHCDIPNHFNVRLFIH